METETATGTTMQEPPCCMGEPQKQHQWLQKFVGEWTYESEFSMQPGQPPQMSRGTETVRSLGGLWVASEGQGEMPGGGTWTMLTTLGFDPHAKRFVGTWVASMMPQLWVYDGELDADEKTLTLFSKGPAMDASGEAAGKVTQYKDVVTLSSDDERVMASYAQGEDGNWHQFGTACYRRVK